jgi:hypothetical protein
MIARFYSREANTTITTSKSVTIQLPVSARPPWFQSTMTIYTRSDPPAAYSNKRGGWRFPSAVHTLLAMPGFLMPIFAICFVIRKFTFIQRLTTEIRMIYEQLMWKQAYFFSV